MPVEITETSIRIRQVDPGAFDPDSFRTKALSAEDGITAVYGKRKGSDTMEVQTLIFDKEKWTLAAVKKWIADHDEYHMPASQNSDASLQEQTPSEMGTQQVPDGDTSEDGYEDEPGDVNPAPNEPDPRKYLKVQYHLPAYFTGYRTKPYRLLPQGKDESGNDGVYVSLGTWRKTGAQVIQKFLFETGKGWTDEKVNRWFLDHPQYPMPQMVAQGIFVALSDDATPEQLIENLICTEAQNPLVLFDQSLSPKNVILIREGWGKNRRKGSDGNLYRDYFTASFIEGLVPITEGTAIQMVKVHPPSEKRDSTPPDLIRQIAADLAQYGHPPDMVNMLFHLGLSGNAVAFLRNVHTTQSSDLDKPGKVLRASYVSAETPDALQAQQLWQSAYRHGLSWALGLSINYKAGAVFTQIDGQPACVFTQATQHVSTEFVINPAAGGKFELLSAAQDDANIMGEERTMEELKKQNVQTQAPLAPENEKPTQDPGNLSMTQAEQLGVTPKTTDPLDVAALKSELLQAMQGNLKDIITPLAATIAAIQEINAKHDLTGIVQKAEIPPSSKQTLFAQIADGKMKTAEEVTGMISLVQAALAEATPKVAPILPGLSGYGSKASIAVDQKDYTKMRSLLTWGIPLTQAEQDLAGKYHVSPFSGIQEEYIALTGDTGMRMKFDPNVFLARIHPSMVQDRGWFEPDGSFTQATTYTTTYTDFLTHVINRTLELNYRNQDKTWEKIVQKGVPYNDNRDQTHFVVGQFGEISTVAEGGSYTDIAKGKLESVTSSSVKKGNLFVVTEEVLQNDDLDYVKSSIEQIGLAANRTMFRAVLDKVIGYGTAFNNATMTDSIAGVLYSAANRRNFVAGTALDFDAMRQLIACMQDQVDLLDDAGNKAPMVLNPYLFIASVNNIGFVKARVKGPNEPGRSDVLPNTLYLDTIPDGNFIGVHTAYLREHPEALIVMPNPMEHSGLKLSYFRGMETPEMVWEGSQQPAYGSVFSSDTLKMRIKFKYRLYYQRLSAFYGLFQD